MSTMQEFENYLGNIDDLFDHHFGEKANTKDKEYIHPKLKNLGAVSLVVVREVIAPFVVRNFEEGITDIELGKNHELHVRAVPNKFKYPERGRGLQLLRLLNCGGTMPQNKTQPRSKTQKPAEFYDLNTLVFGDSSVQDGRILSVKAGVNYSDALSVLPKELCVGETAHISAMESGTLYDDERQESSVNLFNRHFVLPGTLLVQVLSTRGRVMPRIGLGHLLLCLGVAGTYGGQTSITGTNIRTHLAGLYGDAFEQAQTSPYELLKTLPTEPQVLTQDVGVLSQYLHGQLSPVHQLNMDATAITAYQHQLLDRFEQDFNGLKKDYQHAKGKLDEFFNGWFIKPEKKKKAS
ncbi:MAG: type I-D CRISPR-associated protein Csc2 [Thiothrix sp.]|nr:type I-D CRISPR-associated protein Csc2 [Thiothrix sp.]HPE59339.1 type I-D CRISPR-associated protein Csc2 [Thiolinea sp.]